MQRRTLLSTRPGATLAVIIGLSSLILTAHSAVAQVQFEDVTGASGITYWGESYGASWGDVNGDGRPDLFVNHHRSTPSLLVNLGGNQFEDRWFEVDRWRTYPLLDQHGGSWVDFDNDGDQDLFVSLGRKDSLQFLVNEDGLLTDQTVAYGLGLVRWEARMPSWFDFSQDGTLDWMMANRGSQAQVWAQLPGKAPAQTFIKQNAASQQACIYNQYLQLADLNNDGTLDLICQVQDNAPNKVYDFHTMPFVDMTSILPPVSVLNDSVVADFDGNLQTDVLIVRGVQRVSGAEINASNTNEIQAYISTDGIKERGFNFVTSGDLSFSLSWNARNTTNIHIGSSGYSLPYQPGGGPLVWNLSAADPDNVGIQPHDPTKDSGIYIGFDPNTQRWTVLVSPGNSRNATYWFVNSTAAMSSLATTGLQFGDRPVAPALLMNSGGTFSDQAPDAGLGDPISCVSAAAADFDNDMDIDLYFVCRGAVSNIENRYYENQGNGVFTQIATSGAEGPVGLGGGLGENVVTADFDLDGFVDLFVTNGLSMYPEDALTVGGPDQLYRNTGNGNHWIELDLTGTVANRDAIGAKVYVTAGGVTQLREQNGGYHRWAQNHQRLHVGLGTNTTVKIEVHWPSPSTQVDTFTAIAADGIYRITEGGSVDELPVPSSVPPSPCEEPTFDKGTESGIFLWKECNTGSWHMRASPGGQPLTFGGSLVANQPFSSVTGVSIEQDDLLDYVSDPTRVAFSLQVATTGIDGIDFSFPPGSGTCFLLDTPADTQIFIGKLRRPVNPPFDLDTMGICGDMRPTVAVAATTVAENAPNGQAAVTISLSKASASAVSVDVVSSNNTATAPDDYTELPPTTITFAPGEVSKTVPIAIVDDTFAEGNEAFSVTLSNAMNSLIQNGTAQITIIDDEPSPCGAPVYNRATEQGVFLWKDCPNGVWHARMTAGKGSVTHEGVVIADQDLLNVTPVGLESADSLDVTSDPRRFSYRMTGGAGTQDGVDFGLAAGSRACFQVDAPAAVPVYVGAARTPATAPFDLTTLAACNSLLPTTIAISNLTVAEDVPGGIATVTLTLSRSSDVSVAVDVTSADGTATATDDYAPLPPTTVTFAPGEISRTVEVAIHDDDLPEASETFVLTLSNPLNGVLSESSATATVTITDNEPSPCGTPVYNRTTEKGVFVWKDCTSGSWFARMTAGTDTVTYRGTIAADTDFLSIAGFSLEQADTLDTSDPTRATYTLSGGPGTQDGVNFAFPAGAQVCFAVDEPASVPVYLGAARTAMTAPFDLETQGACLVQP